jgi:hypothetical protein
MITRIRSRAKRSNIPFEIDESDIIIPEYCPILNIKLNFNVGKGRKNWRDSPSLDRINPSLGYVKNNIRVISNRANLLKSNAEVWELEAVLNDLKRIREC